MNRVLLALALLIAIAYSCCCCNDYEAGLPGCGKCPPKGGCNKRTCGGTCHGFGKICKCPPEKRPAHCPGSELVESFLAKPEHLDSESEEPAKEIYSDEEEENEGRWD